MTVLGGIVYRVISLWVPSRTLKRASLILALGLVFGGFTNLTINSNNASAYSATLTTASSVSVDVTPTSSGTTGTTIDTENLGVVTNCRAGYNLTISGSNDRNLYLNGNSANNTSGQYFTPVDGTSTLTNSPDKWGYSLTANTASGVFTPLSNTATAIRTSSQTASQTDINDQIPIYYGVAVSNTMHPGSYTMSNNDPIVYQLTMDESCQAFTVEFDANGGTGTMQDQDIQLDTATKLTANSFNSPAKGQSYQDSDGNTITADPDKLWAFWGWNTEVDGTGDWYKNRESVTNLANNGETITLYAQWKQATLADMSTPTSGTRTITDNTMQDMSAEVCYNSPITTAANAPAAVLTDNRDGTTRSYNVSKLADGNCWMTTNLALGTTSAVTLTSDDTDLADGTTFTLPAGDTTSYTATTRLAKVRLTNNSSATTNGAYYSWNAAVASTASVGSTTVTTSICPKNWDLPTNNQYGNLSTAAAYSSSNLTTAAPSSFLISSAGFTNGSSFYQTSYGFYWTSTSSSTTAAYGVRVSSSAFTRNATTGSTYGGNKYYRKNIRCVASNGTANITYHSNNTASTTSTQSVDIGSGTLAASSLFTAESHKQFKEWNTSANGTGTSYAAGASVSSAGLYPGQSLELYAIWNDTWTITFVNTATSATQTKNIVQGQSGAVAPTTTWSRTGYKLIGWDTNSAGTNVVYTNGQSITPTGDITVYTVWAPIYTVQYDGNGSDNDSTGMGSTDATTGIKSVAHTNVAEGDTFDLFASNFKKAGYGFVGWSTDSNAWDKLMDNDNTNDAKIWGPNEVITAPAYNGTPITTLYAVWAPAETSGGNPVYLQGWTGCSTMTATTYNSATGTLTVAKNSVTALTDERDGNVYAVAKLADENCWMIENLRLDNTPELSATNTNIDSSNSTLPITNEYGSTTSNYLSATSSSWCTSDTATCDDQSRLNTANTIANITPSQTQSITSANAHINFDNTIYAYGNYYNWYSATAGYGTYSRTTSTPTDGDLCPAGWKLPYGNTGTSGTNIGNTKGGFYYLANRMSATSSNQINSNKFRMFPNNFIYSGHWNGDSATDRGSNGYYWSASALNSSFAYRLFLFGTGVDPGNGYRYKYGGYSVRCVQSDITSITFDKNANDATGTMNNQSIVAGSSANLRVNAYSRTNYTFAGWNTAANGSGTSYADGASYTAAAGNASVTLYAQWERATLYNTVASMTQGTQTAAELQDNITTSNSGVFTYDASVFGASSDDSNTYPIYYYRGILDSDDPTYGSAGNGATWPNYVRLGDTCWRIVRTTGSGGVKMIYNGEWTGSTCANSTTSAQLSNTSAYNGTSATSPRVALVGYTYNPTYGDNTVTTTTSTDLIFGSNSNYSVNSANSTIKTAVENWFDGNSDMVGYQGAMETSAGYCNDRSHYDDSMDPSSTALPYYAGGYNDDATVFFGADMRNAFSGSVSLTCPRGTVDIYSASSATSGNGQLTNPVALLTADEAALAGNGHGPYDSSSYNIKSYLGSGSNFWLFSPSGRSYAGDTTVFSVKSSGELVDNDNNIDDSKGVRPVISLKNHTMINGGSGTATSPWTIDICNPTGTTISGISCMQDISSTNKSSIINSMTTNAQYVLTDSRDGKGYYVAKLGDGNIWMTQNLDLEIEAGRTYTSADTNMPSGASWTPVTSTYTDSTWSTDLTLGQGSYDPGDRYWNGTPKAGNNPLETETTSSGNRHYHVGNYYNLPAAVARDTITNDTFDVSYNRSVCPAGWNLSGSSNDANATEYSFSYANLINTLSLTPSNIHLAPTYYVYGGVRENTTPGQDIVNASRGAYYRTGDYGSSSGTDTNGRARAAIMRAFNDGSVVYGNIKEKRLNGYPVRCVVPYNYTP